MKQLEKEHSRKIPKIYDKKSVLKAIEYFRKIYDEDYACVLISGTNLDSFIEKISVKDSDYIFGNILKINDSLIAFMLNQTSKNFHSFKELVTGDSMASMYTANGIFYLANEEIFYNTHDDYYADEFIMFGNILEMMAVDVFLGRLIIKLKHLHGLDEDILIKHLHTPFVQSLANREKEYWFRTVFHDESKENSRIESIFKTIPKKGNPYRWAYSYRINELLYPIKEDDKGEKHEV